MSSKPPFSELFFSKTKDFLDIYLARQADRSPETIKAYRIALTSFYTYVTAEKSLNVTSFCFTDCTYEFVLSYSQYLQEKEKLSNSSVNQRLAALKAYLKYVSDGDIALIQVYLGIQKVPLLKIAKLQRPILEKDVLKILLEKPPATARGNRDRMIMILLFDSAIRVAELLNITLGDISLKRLLPTIVIHGKGKKERVISLNDRTAEHLREYIKHFHTPESAQNTPLFYTVIHGEMKKMSERNVERIVKKYADLVRAENPDIPDSVYPHMFRRTRASGLYRDGVPIEMISAILGHTNSETTKIYAIPSVEQMRAALQKGQPEDDSAEQLWKGKEEEIRKIFGLN